MKERKLNRPGKTGLFLISSLVLAGNAAASTDYSKGGNSNPVARYYYQQPQNRQALGDENYRTRKTRHIASNLPQRMPSGGRKVSSKKIESKYIHLIRNANNLNGCWDAAARRYNVDPWMLMAIAKVESSFNNHAVNTANRNKSTDYGMMQINSVWLPTLKKHNISKADLHDPCTSVHVGAWIMSQNISKFGYNLDGIGAYNSPGNKTIRRNYAMKVMAAYKEITNDLYYNAQPGQNKRLMRPVALN